MKLSAQRSLLPGADLSERFQRAAECGLDGIELAVGRSARVYELRAEIDCGGWLALECIRTPGDPQENTRACVKYLRGCWDRA